MSWQNTSNLVGLQYPRSILGYAGESLVIGRALICGYNLFFKAWRDSKYDAVLDSAGTLFRVEIKQTSTGKYLTLTSGGRSGAQINRAAGSRAQVVSTQDSDFLIGVNSMDGLCWIIPSEFIEIVNKNSLPVAALEPFKEKWGIFHVFPLPNNLNQIITRAVIKDGFRQLGLAQMLLIYTSLGLQLTPPNLPAKIKISSNSRYSINIQRIEDWYAINIWLEIFRQIR